MFFSRSGVGPALRNNAQSAQATAESGVGTAERRARERDTHLSLRATCDCGGNGMGGGAGTGARRCVAAVAIPGVRVNCSECRIRAFYRFSPPPRGDAAGGGGGGLPAAGSGCSSNTPPAARSPQLGRIQPRPTRGHANIVIYFLFDHYSRPCADMRISLFIFCLIITRMRHVRVSWGAAPESAAEAPTETMNSARA